MKLKNIIMIIVFILILVIIDNIQVKSLNTPPLKPIIKT
jgi:hypothetical protein